MTSRACNSLRTASVASTFNSMGLTASAVRAGAPFKRKVARHKPRAGPKRAVCLIEFSSAGSHASSLRGHGAHGAVSYMARKQFASAYGKEVTYETNYTE